MPCEYIKLPNGLSAIVYSRGRAIKPCRYCGRRGEKLCDFKLSGGLAGTTCDVPMYARCAMHVEPDTDFCKPHARIIGEREIEKAVVIHEKRRQAELDFDRIYPPEKRAKR